MFLLNFYLIGLNVFLSKIIHDNEQTNNGHQYIALYLKRIWYMEM